jgi:HPt (histidine-containing phosphotransfer) domain-containing protein
MDPEDYRESAALFVELAPGMADELRAFSGAGDLTRLRMLAHRLVGTVGFFDLDASACARRLESAIAAGQVGDLPGLVAALESALAVLARRLAASSADPMAEPHGGPAS